MSARSSSHVARRQIHRSARLGLIGALLVYTGLVTLWLVATPLFLLGDESPHVDYARELAHGNLPVVESPMTREFPELGQGSRRQYVSNHPPAYHALVAPLVRAAEASEHPRAFLLLARALTAALGAAVLLTLAATAVTVFRRGTRKGAVAMIASVSLAGSLAALVAVSATIRNDVLTVLMVCATLLVLARSARSGQRPTTVAIVAALCTLGMLTRIAFLPAWLLAIAAVAALELWPRLRRRRPGIAEVRRGALAALTVLVVPLLGAGWFYALSLQRYGDLTGGSAVYPWVADREFAPGAEDGPLTYMLLPSTWWTQIMQLGGSRVDTRIHAVLGSAVLAVLLIAVVAAVLDRTRHRGMLDVPARWILVGLALVAAATYAELASHVSHKGSETQRYLLNGIGFWAIGGAALLSSAPRRLIPYLVTLMATLLSIGSVTGAVGALREKGHVTDRGWYETLVHGTELAGFPAGHLLVASLLATVAVGLALQFVALRRLTTAPIPANHVPTPQRPPAPGDPEGVSGGITQAHRRAASPPVGLIVTAVDASGAHGPG